MNLHKAIFRKLFFKGKITGYGRKLVRETNGLKSITFDKRNSIIYFDFNVRHSFNDVVPKTALNVNDFHISAPKHTSSCTEGDYHLTFDVRFENKVWSFHSYYDENDNFLLSTIRDSGESRKEGVKKNVVQLIESAIDVSYLFKTVDESNPLFQADISKIRKWAEGYYKELMAELKVGLVRLDFPSMKRIEEENQELEEMVNYFSDDFWPEGMKEKRQLYQKKNIKKLIEIGAFTKDPTGLKLYEIISKKKKPLVDEVRNNLLAFNLAVQELLRYDLLTVDSLELLDKSSDPRASAFSLATLNRHGLFNKHIDKIKKASPEKQIDVVYALIILYQLNANAKVDEALFRELCSHSSPKDFALLLSVMSHFEANEHGSLKKENIDLAYKYASPQFLEAYFKYLKEKNKAFSSNSKIVSFEDELKGTSTSSHLDRMYLEQVWFIINNKFTKESNSELLGKILSYSGSCKELYESVLFFIIEGMYQREEDIEVLQLILESPVPLKLSQALNMLMAKDLLKDVDLRGRLTSLLSEVGDNCINVSQTVIHFKNADLLSLEMFPLLKKIKLYSKARSRENVLSHLNQLLGTPEKKELFLPLILSIANLMSHADIALMIKFLKFFYNDKHIVSIFYEEECFLENMKEFFSKNNNNNHNHNTSHIELFLSRVADFIKKLDSMGLLSAVTLNTLLHMEKSDVTKILVFLHESEGNIDLNSFMNMMHDFLKYNLYQGFYKMGSTIQLVVLAYQNITNYFDPTEDILAMLVNAPPKNLEKISMCGSIEELYQQYIIYHEQQIKLYEKQTYTDEQQWTLSYHQQTMFSYQQAMFSHQEQITIDRHQQQPAILYQHSRLQPPGNTNLAADNSTSLLPQKRSLN